MAVETGIEYQERFLEADVSNCPSSPLSIREIGFKCVPTNYLVPTQITVAHLTYHAARQLAESGHTASKVIFPLRGSAPILRRTLDVIDAVRQLDGQETTECTAFAMGARFYGNRTEVLDDPKILYLPDTKIDGEELVLVDDVLDQGLTIGAIIKILLEKRAKKIGVVVPLEKQGAKRVEDSRVDYHVGAKIDRQWVCFPSDPYETMISLDHIWSEAGYTSTERELMCGLVFGRITDPFDQAGLVTEELQYFLKRRYPQGAVARLAQVELTFEIP